VRRHRIYHPEPLQEGAKIVLGSNAARHISRVLRLTPGDEIFLFNGDGNEYAARLETASGGKTEAMVGAARRIDCESPVQLLLLQGICRGQKMDLVIQKATELGVTSIQPLSCERSVVRLDPERAQRRREHWQGVAVGAAEQCGRGIVPVVGTPAAFDPAVQGLPDEVVGILLDPEGEQSFRDLSPGPGTLALLAGPEGGLSPAERESAVRAGFRRVRLGPRILRTETAALVALSILQYLHGDLALS
jgi:16S rRNA (uracil1498-N3)-methyltransferase